MTSTTCSRVVFSRRLTQPCGGQLTSPSAVWWSIAVPLSCAVVNCSLPQLCCGQLPSPSAVWWSIDVSLSCVVVNCSLPQLCGGQLPSPSVVGWSVIAPLSCAAQGRCQALASLFTSCCFLMALIFPFLTATHVTAMFIAIATHGALNAAKQRCCNSVD